MLFPSDSIEELDIFEKVRLPPCFNRKPKQASEVNARPVELAPLRLPQSPVASLPRLRAPLSTAAHGQSNTPPPVPFGPMGQAKPQPGPGSTGASGSYDPKHALQSPHRLPLRPDSPSESHIKNQEYSRLSAGSPHTPKGSLRIN